MKSTRIIWSTRGEVKLIWIPYELPVIGGNEVVVNWLSGQMSLNFSVGEALCLFTVYHSVVSKLLLTICCCWCHARSLKISAVFKWWFSCSSYPLDRFDCHTASLSWVDVQVEKANTRSLFLGGTGGVGAMAIPLAARLKGKKSITNGSVENKERVCSLEVSTAALIIKTLKITLKTVANVDYVLDAFRWAGNEKQMDDHEKSRPPGLFKRNAKRQVLLNEWALPV